MNDRAKIHVSDVVMATVVTVAALALSPVIYDLAGLIAADAGPLGSMLALIVVPLLLIGIVVSVGVSARRRA